MTLPEDSPPEQIVGWFRDNGWELTLHTEAPPRGATSHVPQALRALPRFTHWADLVSLQNGDVVKRWYGGGLDRTQAVRSARRRWRSEHGDSGSEPEEGSQATSP